RRALAAERVDQRPELLPHLRVETDRWLVHEHKLRPVHERAGDQEPPPHPAGKLVDAGVPPVDEPRHLERPLDRLLPVRAVDPVEVREDQQVLLDGERDIEVVELRHHAALRAGLLRVSRQREAEHLELALVGDRLRGEQPHRRRLAGAVGAEQADARPDGNVEVEPVDGDDVSVVLEDAAQANRELLPHAPSVWAERRGEACLGLAHYPSCEHGTVSVLDAIGNTPLVQLHRCTPANGAELWVKLEYLNPTGSMKDRLALAMIDGAERDGLLAPGDTVVEYTGGSTGPAIAFVCGVKGYRALIVIADCFTEERFQFLRALGAEIDVVPSVRGRPNVTPQDIENMVARAGELAARPGHYATDQFNNPYGIAGMGGRLGREIWEQSHGRVTAFCHGVGTAS